MLKVVSTEFEEGRNFEIEDDTEDFDQMAMELSVLIRFAYDALREAAEQEDVEDPEFEARQYIHAVVDNAFDEDILETTGGENGDERGKILKLVDDYIDKNKN